MTHRSLRSNRRSVERINRAWNEAARIALDAQIHAPEHPTIGTGPFFTAATLPSGIEMAANESYYAGRPTVDKVVLKPYESFRSAWADMLRGHLDMLYEVGVEGLDSLEP